MLVHQPDIGRDRYIAPLQGCSIAQKIAELATTKS
jgi:hypothetical protein